MSTDKFQNKYRIPSARATCHHYSGGEYFVTICTAHREHYFGEIRNGVMEMNKLGLKLDELIREIPDHHSYAIVPVYQVMPNHVHIIVCIDGGDGRDVACRVSKTGVSIDTDAAGNIPINRDGVNLNKLTRYASINRDAACHVSTNGNEKMRAMAQKRGLLSVAIGNMKSALTKFAHTNEIEFGWQTRFHDHIIRNQNEMYKIATYIENNPATWKEDKFYSENSECV